MQKRFNPGQTDSSELCALGKGKNEDLNFSSSWLLLSDFHCLLRTMSDIYLKIESLVRQGFLSLFCVPVLMRKKTTSYKGQALGERHVFKVGFT